MSERDAEFIPEADHLDLLFGRLEDLVESLSKQVEELDARLTRAEQALRAHMRLHYPVGDQEQ